ncbi:hypothetical protein H0E84_09075 [Luteimonas sp. SJ-92]|uniref:Uncharacterized protein n=1 Tax=Luteimonas salinisoli TaxID=2752307 RepID=A0A853JD40_9GAMM|nr:hypothetical protein [Luteimonas salinisoli]NZA26537.1 hypothetical protein [Luteimonas salinisoli]
MKLVTIFVVVALMLVSGGANSYELRRYSIEEKVKESDVVFLGEVEQVIDLAPNANSIRTVARFRVAGYLQGQNRIAQCGTDYPWIYC